MGDRAVVEILLRVARSEDLTIIWTPTPPSKRPARSSSLGVYYPEKRALWIKSDEPTGVQAEVLAHELAHHFTWTAFPNTKKMNQVVGRAVSIEEFHAIHEGFVDLLAHRILLRFDFKRRLNCRAMIPRTFSEEARDRVLDHLAPIMRREGLRYERALKLASAPPVQL